MENKMNDNDSIQILSEIRDEMKEINAQIKWLTAKAGEEMAEDKEREQAMLKIAELEHKKSKKDLLTFVALIAVPLVWLAIAKLDLL
ncbi:hypothetical protein [Pseudoalteromonas sp. BDTF-M6]|uniref:hypothetical protein n=1 Tax=Pseudoalteromonas sp. BDTF-M6 TaxID=2796132 RepID=UPI001BAE9FFB|nr:hypothetical protein [Pseudoalteromonas sp. BDTF-M6]MBS3798162.1 hypothetical protein [Pseudoalteromonas sp. BDTF-M6]